MMMKRESILWAAIWTITISSIVSCKGMNQKESLPTSYIVEGILAGVKADGMNVYLYETETRQYVDTAVVTGDKFCFTGVADSAIECQIVIPEYRVNGYNGTFILENGHIHMDLGESSHSPTGTPLNEEFRRIHALEDSLKQADAPEEVYRTYSRQVFNGHEDDAVGYSLLRSRFFTHAGTNSEKLALLESLGPGIKRTGHYQFRLSSCVPNQLIGQNYKEIVGTDAKGEPIALSNFVGKGNYVLLDMWASWCAPCNAEVPYLKRLHNQYKDKGLSIVGIFTWDKAENLTKAVEENDMRWPQIVDKEKTAMELYQTAGVPTMVLISPDGIILEIDLKFRGENMVQIVEKYLKD